MKNNPEMLENRFPMESAPSECKKKRKFTLMVEISTKKVKKCSFWILETPKKLFSTQKKFWECKILVYTCFYKQNLRNCHSFWNRLIFRPDRPIGLYICFSPPYRYVALQNCPSIVKGCLSFRLVGLPAPYLKYWLI